jgi:site-specific recombinase XerD
VPKLSAEFNKLRQKYLDILVTSVEPSTTRFYGHALNNLFRFIMAEYSGIVSLSELKRSPHIESWLSSLTMKGLSKGTRHMMVCCVRRFFNDIYDWGWERAPEPGLITSRDIPAPDKTLPKPLSPEDDKKLQEYYRKKNNSLFPQALFLLRKTGMRIGELSDLKLDCLEKISDGQYSLHVPLGKLHTERKIPVDTETVEIINRIKGLRGRFSPLTDQKTNKEVQYLLIKRKRQQRPSYSGLRRCIARDAKAAGIKGLVTPHMLRHTYATQLLRAGVNLVVLKELLGHKDISMTLRYTLVVQQDINVAYHKAINSLNPMEIISRTDSRNESLYDSIESAITKLHSMRNDSNEIKLKTKLLRIAERLRRAKEEILKTLND